MKKVLFLILSLVFAFALISCEGGPKTEEVKEAPAVEQTTTVDSTEATVDSEKTDVAPPQGE